MRQPGIDGRPKTLLRPYLADLLMRPWFARGLLPAVHPLVPARGAVEAGALAPELRQQPARPAALGSVAGNG